MEEEKKILVNQIKTPDGTVIISKHVHDFVEYTDKNGQYYAVDGGDQYLRRVCDKGDYEELSIYDNGDHKLRRQHLRWGNNYDKDMNKLPETVWNPIMDMTTEHIEAILHGGWCKNPFYAEVFFDELKLRKAARYDKPKKDEQNTTG